MFKIRTFSVRLGARNVLNFASGLLSATFALVSVGLFASGMLPQMHAGSDKVYVCMHVCMYVCVCDGVPA
jgi:hypothetical protein